MAEWSIAAVLKTVDCNRSGGSNPSLSARSQIKNYKKRQTQCLPFFIGSVCQNLPKKDRPYSFRVVPVVDFLGLPTLRILDGLYTEPIGTLLFAGVRGIFMRLYGICSALNILGVLLPMLFLNFSPFIHYRERATKSFYDDLILHVRKV